MTMNSDQAKGKLKEAAGILTGDEKLENEGIVCWANLPENVEVENY